MPGKNAKQTILPYHYNPLTMVRTNHEWSQRGLLHPLALASAFPTPPRLHAPRGAPPRAPAGRPALRHWPPVGRCVGGCCGRSGFLEWMCSGRWKYLNLIKMIEDFCRRQNSLYTLAVLHIWKNVENWSTRQIKCIGIATAKNDRTVRPPGFAVLTYPVNIIYNYSICFALWVSHQSSQWLFGWARTEMKRTFLQEKLAIKMVKPLWRNGLFGADFNQWSLKTSHPWAWHQQQTYATKERRSERVPWCAEFWMWMWLMAKG